MIGIFFLGVVTAPHAMVFDNSALLAPNASASSPQHLICRHEIVTGTRITPLVCKTLEEWSRNVIYDDSIKVVIQVKYHGMNQSAH